jgi:glycosyltransferase involved in cell wall biosynthesis
MTGPHPAPQCLLHVFLLTYNREKSFRRTLEAIAASPLKDHPLTVMDNCSTDGTPRVCEDFRPLLPRMEVRRHERNIGFGPNYYRSVETSQGEYTWIICDDDTFFPDHVAALLDLLRDARPQACFVGGPRQEQWPHGLNILPMDIQRNFRTFLTAQSFVPALVFKTSLIDSPELVEGYFTIGTKFPQCAVGKKLLLENIPCAVLHPPVIQREPPVEAGTNPLEVVDGWSQVCHSLPPGLRTHAFYSIFVRPDMTGMIREILRMILWMKINGGDAPDYHLVRIGLNAGFPPCILISFCRLACLIPGSVYNLAREIYRKVKYGWLGKPLPPTYHTRIEPDGLRR